jgi:two-component system alkaline phosphatase synthesis response regulator PhoP
VPDKSAILIVDDEQDILDLIEYNLKKEGFDILKAKDGIEGMEMARKHNFDLILLDIMIPKMNGMKVLERMRADQTLKHTPVIFLTARGDEKTEVEELNKGGDDYITKPISTTKLVSRIKAVLRRYEKTSQMPDKIVVHDIVIDKDRYIVFKGDEEFQMPRKEFELLYFLARNKSKVTDRQTLLDQVWDHQYLCRRPHDRCSYP